MSFLGAWGVLSGYIGLSWAFPALLVGLAAASVFRDWGLPLHRALGTAVGVTAGVVLLFGAAQFVGT
jgi:hypothetical protein